MFIEDLMLFFQVKWFLFKEKREVRRCFPGFAIYERAFRRAYRLVNPFRVCKSHLKKRGETDLDGYGETPLPALAHIAEFCELKSEDVLLELGCGRGRGTVFFRYLTGCRAIGIDWVPFFIDRAKEIAALDVERRIDFRCEDMLKTDFSGASVIYLYGTCLSDQAIDILIDRLQELPPSVRILTVSYPLSDYTPRFSTSKQTQVVFPWGVGEVFLNTLTASL